MKVVQINSECGRGSTGKIAVAISRRLDKNGIDNVIFYSANHRSDDPHGILIGSKPMLRLHQLLSRIFGDAGFHSRFATKKLVKRIKAMNPELILLHNLHGYYLHLGVLFRFLQEFNKPVIWVLHDCWSFTGHCTHYRIAKCDRWQTGCHDCPNQKKYPYSWFFDRSRSLYERKKALIASVKDLTLVMPSDWLRSQVKKSYLKEKRMVTIHNGIDLSVFQPRLSNFREKYAINQRVIILGVASVWSYAKGLDVFIDLANTLDPDRYAIVLIGTDDEVDRCLPSNIISIHRTADQKTLAQIYTAADVFVNPTREDTFPTVNLEALACGTPVISFDTGGCKETIVEGCGTLVKSNTVEELSDILLVADLKSDETAKKCTAAAREFDEHRCFQQYIDVIIQSTLSSGANKC